MPFISNAEREQRTKKLYRGNAFRKIWLLVTCIAAGLLVAYILIAIGITGFKLDSDIKQLNQFEKYFSFVVIDETTNQVTDVNYTVCKVCFAFSVTVGAMLLTSLILTFTFKSNKAIAKEAIDLVSTPVGGRNQKNKSTAAKARERLGKE